MNAPANVQDFLRFNHADARKLFERLDHIHLVAIMPDAPKGTLPHGKYFGSDVDAALSWAAKVNGNGWGVYWTLNYVGPSVGTKPKKDDIQAARGAHCDLDPPKDGRAWDKGEAIGALADHTAPPSLVIDSGNGLQPVWLLDEPAREWSQIEATNTGIRDTFGGDDCHNIDRLLRVPGSVNYPSQTKRARGYLPCMATWALEDTGQRYRPDELSAAFPASHRTDQRAPANDSDRVPTQTGALIAAIRRGDNWHNNVLRLTAHLVAKGRTTVEILAMADCLTLPGYTVDDTRADMHAMIEDARRKWEYAEPADPQMGYVDERGEWTAYSDDWQAPGEEPPALNLLPVVNFADWQGNPPVRRSAWGDLLPLHTTTMLTGPGGVGKSLFEQMLLTCIALGLPFLGQRTEQMNTLYVTCEDDTAEIWRRQCAINSMLGIGMADLQGKLHLVSLAGEADTALATFNDAGQVKPTARWRSIEATCEALNIRALAFDNATDAMAGDLNDLHQVAEFVSMMTGLAIRRDGIAMILHHPNKAGDEWLGSIAWNNKVRSRLIIERPDEHDPDLRCVKNPKANYGPSGGEIRFRWHEGAFARDEDLSDDTARKLRELSVCNAQNSAFLACLREREKQGVERMVGPSTGPNYAPAQFEGMPQAKGYKRQALKAAMDRLFDLGVIETKQIARPGKSDTKTVIVERAPNGFPNFPNAAPNGSRTRLPNGPEHQPERSLSYPVYPTDNKGAAHGPAAPLSDELDWTADEETDQ